MTTKKEGKEFQEYRKQWELATKMEILTEVPLHIDIELTNKCNLDCKMCWQNEEMTYSKGNMDFTLFKKIIDESVISGVKAIKLQSRGESTIYPKLFDAIKYAKKKGIMDIQITTNATMFKSSNNNDFLTSGLDLLIISIDNDHIESYNRLNKDKNYEEVVQNILNLLIERDNRKLKSPQIRLQITSATTDINPLVAKYKESFEKYVDYFTIDPYFLLSDNDGIVTNPRTTPCPYPWQRLVINYDGKVTVCCRDFNCSMIMGDIKNETLSQIWNSDKFNNFRELHSLGRRAEIDFCRICNS